MAVTEVHLHCHREEQLRWFKHVWNAARRVKEEGVDIKGVTSWSMLGSYGWNKLLTQPGGDYEPGAFDLRGGYLRPTALAKYIMEIASSNKTDHHLSEEKGWWQRDTRLLYHSGNRTIQMTSNQTAPVLIIGKNGTLGRAFARICEERCINYQLLSRQDCDISQLPSVEAAINHYKPWAIINAAGYVRVDDAENDSQACMRDNTTGPYNLAVACNKHGISLISFSSDLVFDGYKPIPYMESDLPNPLNVYGESKAQAELLIQKECPSALILRTSAFFGPWDEYNFIHHVCRQLSQFERICVAKDLHVSPTYIPHLTNATLDVLIDGESGIWHFANKGAITWSELAYMTADRFGLDQSFISPVNADQLNFAAQRPFYSVLGTERGQLLPSFEEAFNQYFQSKPANLKVA
jgi:dTDP-4-dehydrorhamnose reductase